MKTCLIIHGFPQELHEDHPVYLFFKQKGYRIFAPKLFSGKSDFNLPNTLEIINKSIKTKPDIILGFSLGGILLPYVAEKYPDARLIFIATASRLNPRRGIRHIANLMRTPLIYPLLGAMKIMPYSVYFSLYNLFVPCGKDDDKTWYMKDKRYNYEAMRAFKARKVMQIIDFLCRTDNTALLKKLKNKSLIVSGTNDLMMPLEEGKKLKGLLKNSTLITLDRSHFGLIDTESLSNINGWIKHNI